MPFNVFLSRMRLGKKKHNRIIGKRICFEYAVTQLHNGKRDRSAVIQSKFVQPLLSISTLPIHLLIWMFEIENLGMLQLTGSEGRVICACYSSSRLESSAVFTCRWFQCSVLSESHVSARARTTGRLGSVWTVDHRGYRPLRTHISPNVVAFWPGPRSSVSLPHSIS